MTITALALSYIWEFVVLGVADKATLYEGLSQSIDRFGFG